MITLTKNQIIGAATLVLAMLGGWLVRHDYQVTTDQSTKASIDENNRRIEALRLQMDRLNAYAVANYAWNVKVSQKMGWPDPPQPSLFLPAMDVPRLPRSIWGDLEAAEPGR